MEKLDNPIAVDKIIRKTMRFDVDKASKWNGCITEFSLTF